MSFAFPSRVSQAVLALLAVAALSGTSNAQGDNSRVHLCGQGTTQYSPRSGDKCPDGSDVRRSLALPHSVYPSKVRYETWGLVLHILVTKDGLRLFPRPRDVPHYTEHTDRVVLHPGHPKSFEWKLSQTVEIFSGRSLAELSWDEDSDPNFRVLSLARARERNDPYPAQLYVPKSGERVLFICAVPFLVLRDGTLNDPRCAVRDFTDPSNDNIEFSLRRSSLSNWRQYSTWLWEYVNRASE